MLIGAVLGAVAFARLFFGRDPFRDPHVEIGGRWSRENVTEVSRKLAEAPSNWAIHLDNTTRKVSD